MDETISVVLIQALSAIWSAIRSHHPEVPGVVLLPAPAIRKNTLGHFAPLRWQARQEGDLLMHEVVVVAEHLNRPAEEILETLVHEAAHALNFARGIRDCSRSQYHNAKFKDAAEELGLAVERVPHYGWALTRLTEAVTDRYARETLSLANVLVHRRSAASIRAPPPNGGSDNKEDQGDDNKPRSRSRKATCACPFIIRVSKKTLADTVIRCESCGEPFELA